MAVFLEDCEDPEQVEIISHDTLPHFLGQVSNVRGPVTFQRAVRQFGTEIPREALKNADIGLSLKLVNTKLTSCWTPRPGRGRGRS